MSRRAFRLLPGLLLAPLLPAAEVPAAASPFVPPAGATATAAPAAKTARWELIAIMGTREIPAVRIRDTANDTAAWLGLGETFGTIRVVAADLAASTATVQAGTERIVLPLRVTAVAPGTSVPTPAAAATAGTPPPLPSTGDAAADAKRAQEIAEREARMLVSDLLEISVVQRAEYERKQAEAQAGR
jgi:hypothetical protein